MWETHTGTTAATRGDERTREMREKKKKRRKVADLPLGIETRRGHDHSEISFGSRRGGKSKDVRT
jgi:hypothetical protein